MKRISSVKRSLIIRHEKRIAERLKRKINRKLKCKRHVRSEKNKKISLFNFKTVEIFAPENLSIVAKTSRNDLINAISLMKKELLKGNKIKINFNRTEKLTPEGTLIFVAHIEQMLSEFPGKINCNYPEDETVEQLFQHIGVLSKLGLSSRRTITKNNVRHWYYLTGSCADMSPIEQLFKNYKENITEEMGSGLYDSISEAVTNTINHAYPDSFFHKGRQNKNWWMFAQQLDGNLDVVVYDIGIGIPGSLRGKPDLKEFLKTWTTSWQKKDSYLIEVAIESPRTVTRLPYRGKGLPDMLTFARKYGVGAFMVFSLKGGYIFHGSTIQDQIKRDFDIPLKGTLLHWSIPLQNIQND